MTAIAGVVTNDPSQLDPARLADWREAIQQYGRDAWHEWRHGDRAADGGSSGLRSVACGLLARALLRTLPEDDHDRQPLWHQPSGTALVFDGRIDNRYDIERALGLSPSDVAGMADSELALHAVLAWDAAAPERLRGAFALACWQPGRRRLWLARDAMGHRPLYWCQTRHLLAFASMPAGLLALPGVSRQLDETEFGLRLLPSMRTGPQSIYADLRKVQAGRIVECVDGKVCIRRFHALDPERELRLARPDDYVEMFRAALDQAVRRCLRSSGPVASQLSSGYDSSAVTAVAARLLAESGKTLTAYTAVPRAGYSGPVPPGRAADESVAAAALTSMLPNVEHVCIDGAGRDFLGTSIRYSRLLGEPVLNPCNIRWMDHITRDSVARGAKVLLTGQCGNASISRKGLELLSVLPAKGRFVKWIRQLQVLARQGNSGTLRMALKTSVRPFIPSRLLSLISAEHEQSSTTPPPWSPINPALFLRLMESVRSDSSQSHSWWPSDDAVRRQFISMLEWIELGPHSAAANVAGLDFRDPTKDQDLVECCLAMPLDLYCREGQTRWVLRQAIGARLPPEILDCRAKGYQSADWHVQLQLELPRWTRMLMALRSCPEASRVVDLERLKRSLQQWPSGGWEHVGVIWEFRQCLMRGVIAGAFACGEAGHRAAAS